MNPPSQSARRILRGVGYGAAVVAPLLLLLDLQANFPHDWPNHLWIIGYYGEYFWQHGDLPTLVNIAPAVGMALPVFYAWLFYPALGILTAAVGVGLAVRLAAFGMLAIQFYALISAGRKIFDQPRMAYTVAVSVIWGTYSLTNLYNRGALAEYFATGFLITAIAFATSAIIATPGSSRWFHGWLAGFFLMLAIGTHPPTAVLAAVFIALLGAGLVAGWRRGEIKVPPGAGLRLAGGFLVIGLILSPWIYASVLFGNKLAVTRAHTAFLFCPEHCDTFWGRFAPFPYDVASTENGVDAMGAAYLEAPINIVLLGILLWNLELCRRAAGRSQPAGAVPKKSPARAILVTAIGWFLLLAAISISPWLAGFFVFFAPYIQYVYRLVSHCNAALLVAVFASGVLVARHAGYRRHRHETNLVLAVCLAVAVLGLWIKLQHAAVVAIPGSLAPPKLGEQMELVWAYGVPSTVRRLSDEEGRNELALSFPVGPAGGQFDEIGAVRIELKQADWVMTNAVVFPWMELLRDGKKVPGDQLAREGPFLAIYLSAGSHEIRPVWRPDRVWLFLHRLSQVCFALVLVLTLAWAAVRLFFSRGAAAQSNRAGAPQA